MQKKIINPALKMFKRGNRYTLGQTSRNICDIDEKLFLINDGKALWINDTMVNCCSLVTNDEFAEMSKDRNYASLTLYSNNHNRLINTIRNSTVLIAGAGGVGGTLAIALYKLGIGKIILIDDDIVEKVNVDKSHTYSECDIGRYKVDCINRKCNGNLTTITSRISIDSIYSISSIHNIDYFFWLGDDNEQETYIELLQFCLENKIACFRGGIVEWTVQIGPNFVPNDLDYIDNYKKNIRAKLSTKEINRITINPGNIITIPIASSLLCNELLSVMEKKHSLCQKNMLIFDTISYVSRLIPCNLKEK